MYIPVRLVGSFLQTLRVKLIKRNHFVDAYVYPIRLTGQLLSFVLFFLHYKVNLLLYETFVVPIFRLPRNYSRSLKALAIELNEICYVNSSGISLWSGN